jgi:hypothetical protein
MAMELPDNEAGASAMASSCDEALRVPCYCEENVWRLAYRKLHFQLESGIKGVQYYVVFVSSEEKLIPMLYQKARKSISSSSNEPVFWDYHVILLETKENDAFVFDMDTIVTPFPAPLNLYLDYSFSPDEYTDAVDPRFRVIDAFIFLKYFNSNREHMRINGEWTAVPPTYKCIQLDAVKSTSNLDSYRIMTASERFRGQRVTDKFGKVMTMDELRAFVSNGSAASITH